MKQVGLPLAAAPRYTLWGQRSRAWQNLLALGLLLVCLAYLFTSLLDSWQTRASLKTVQARNLALRTTPTVIAEKPVVAQTSNKNRPLFTGFSNDQRRDFSTVIRRLNTPWYDVFVQLEKSTPPDVALLSVEPDGQRASIKIQAEAKSLDSLLAYAASLQQQGVFGRLSYSKHETNDQDPNKPIRLAFELELKAPPRLALLALEENSVVSKTPAPATAKTLQLRAKTQELKP